MVISEFEVSVELSCKKRNGNQFNIALCFRTTEVAITTAPILLGHINALVTQLSDYKWTAKHVDVS